MYPGIRIPVSKNIEAIIPRKRKTKNQFTPILKSGSDWKIEKSKCQHCKKSIEIIHLGNGRTAQSEIGAQHTFNYQNKITGVRYRSHICLVKKLQQIFSK